MKNIIIPVILIFALAINSNAQKKVVEDSISVSGNCVMCKMRIEAALDLDGVKYSQWNVKTKKLFIAYRSDKITEKEISEAIAKAGHDTKLVKATDSVYADLPFCCLYRDHDPHGPNGEELH